MALIRNRGFDVVGDVERLRVPDEIPERRHPESVTDAEVANVAVETIAVMLADVRRLTQQAKVARRVEQRARRSAPTARRAVRRLAHRLRRLGKRL